MQNKRLSYFFFIFSFLFPFLAFSQDNTIEPVQEVEFTTEDSTCTSFFVDAGSFLVPMNDVSVNGLSVRLGGIRKHSSSALSFDLINSGRMFLPSNVEVKSPNYTYVQVGWDYEYICNPVKRVNVSMHLKTGFGYASYADVDASGTLLYYAMDESSSYYEPVYSYSSGRISSRNFFSLEPGMNVLCKLTGWLGMGAGWNARVQFNMQDYEPMRDMSYYSGNLFLRFRMPQKN